MITVAAGSTITVLEMFVDDYNIPLTPNSAPTVTLLDEQKEVAFLTYAQPDTIPGKWTADITVPLLNNKDALEFSIVWHFQCGRDRLKSSENIIVESSIQERESEAVAIFGDSKFVVNVPFVIDDDTPVISCEFYEENTQLYALPHTDDSITKQITKFSTNLSLPLTVSAASLYSRTLLLRYNKVGMLLPETYTFKIWVITPSIINAASQLENFVNKSRISNVIVELRYAQSDLLLALSRGLEMFNSMGPSLSSFTGTNMQGVLLDSWIICSCINLLNMQYMAEGSLAFDFSGQAVSLNIDRTQYIDAMLGRLDSMVENQVKPLKKLLAKNGITTGDGSIGNKAMSSNFGMLSVTNAPTTRLAYTNSRNSFRHY